MRRFRGPATTVRQGQRNVTEKLVPPRALATRDPGRATAVLAEAGIGVDYVAVADLDGPTLAVAARVGSTRLIDNLPLDDTLLLEGDAAT